MTDATPARPGFSRHLRRVSTALRVIGVVAAGLFALAPGGGGSVLADDSLRFSMTPDQAAYWRFVTDGVMGGVSKGGLRFGRDPDGTAFARMTGDVSTANNGGFIQFRAGISFARLADGGAGLSGMRIRARGNGETYFIHIRTSADRRPWHYFAATFPDRPRLGRERACLHRLPSFQRHGEAAAGAARHRLDRHRGLWPRPPCRPVGGRDLLLLRPVRDGLHPQ